MTALFNLGDVERFRGIVAARMGLQFEVPLAERHGRTALVVGTFRDEGWV